MEQERPESPPLERAEQGRERRLLVGGRHDRRGLARRQSPGLPHVALVDEAYAAALREAIERTPQRRAAADEVGHTRAATGGPQPLQDLRLGAAPRRDRRLGQHRDADLAEARSVDRLLDLHEACAAEPENGPLRVPPEPLSERGQAQWAVLQVPEDGVGSTLARLHEAHDRAARPHARGRKDQPVALARRGEVVIGHPGGEVEQRRLDERALVEHLGDLLERSVPGLRPRSDDDPDHPPAAERDLDPHAELGHGQARGHAVGEGRLERHRQRDGDEACIHGCHSNRVR